MQLSRKKGKRVKYIIVIIFLIFVVILAYISHLQNQKSNDDKNNKNRELILNLWNIYELFGEKGLRNFVNVNSESITPTLILYIVEYGIIRHQEDLINIALITAKEKKDEKFLADVYCKMGELIILFSDKTKAVNYLEKAITIYKRLNDTIGQGNVYLQKGNMHYFNRNMSMANEMYAKALSFYEKMKYHHGMGNVYKQKGNICFLLGDYKNAIKMFDKAVVFFKIIKNQKAENDVLMEMWQIYMYLSDDSRADKIFQKKLRFLRRQNEPGPIGLLYWKKGQMYLILCQYNEGLEMFGKALYYYKKAGLKEPQGDIYQGIGNIYSDTGKHQDALKMYDKALLFYDNKNFNNIGSLYKYKGEVYSKSGESKKAIEMYNNALECYKKTGNTYLQATVYLKIGNLYLQLNNNSKAIGMYQNALDLFEKLDNPGGQGTIYLSKGNIYSFKGEYSKAIKMYNKAIDHYKRKNDSIGQGDVYTSMGNIYSITGENLQALHMYVKAMDSFKRRKSYESLIGQGDLYQKMGAFYYKIGYNFRALKMNKKALSFFEKTGVNIGIANTYIDQYFIYSSNGENSRGIEMLDKSFEYYKKMGNLIGQGNVYQKKGETYFQTGDIPGAFEMYDKALNFLKKSGDIIGQGNVYRSQGEIYFHTGDNSSALNLYNKALSLYKKIEDVESESIVLRGKARVLAKMGKKNDALGLFEKGIAKLEKVRNKTTLSEMKRTFMEKVHEQYEETVLFMLRNNYHEKGFQYAEKMRARVFLDRLAEGMEKVNKGLSPELKKRINEMVFKRSAKRKNIADEIMEENQNQKELEELKKNLDEIEMELDKLYIEIRQKNPRCASIFYPGIVELKNLRQKILKKDELLLEYFVSKESIYLFLVSQEDFKVKKLEADRKKIDGAIKKYINVIPKAQPTKSFSKENDRIKCLFDLYCLIFSPIENDINGRKLIIAPDGQLAKIPFEALVSGRDKKTRKTVFLIEKNPIKYIQSASALAFLRSLDKSDVVNDNLVAFGDPVYDYVNFKMGRPEKGSRLRSPKEIDEIKDFYRSRYIQAGGPFDRLTGSSEEVRTIAGLFEKKGQKPVLYLRDKATENNAKSLTMNRFGYIHFGCHGEAGDEFQSLVLSQDIPGETEDGFFSFDEIMSCDYNAQLVVLSACKTNLGKIARGEGLIGLTRAIMYAGTPAVVSSLWKVNDTAAKELMVRFYKNLLEKGMEKSEALRQAKLELLNSKNYGSPIFWSAFVMYGE
jgi:CHAT domain-containing protein/predicted negative regulator of RcsB-dependent stress response